MHLRSGLAQGKAVAGEQQIRLSETKRQFAAAGEIMNETPENSCLRSQQGIALKRDVNVLVALMVLDFSN